MLRTHHGVLQRFSLALILGTSLAAAALSFHRSPPPVRAQTTVARAAVIQQYFDAINRSDPESALALFADPAVFISFRANGNCPQATPCSDQAGIRTSVLATTMLNSCFTLREIQVAGSVVTGRFEVRADSYATLGIERLLVSFVALIPQDRITFLANLDDVTDPDTVTYLAVTSGAQTAVPLAATHVPCAAVR